MATHTFSVFEFFHDKSFNDYPQYPIVNFSYGLNVLSPVRVVAKSNIDTYGLKTIDNITLSESDRVLLINQHSNQNGIYIVSTNDWTQNLNVQGDAVIVLEGTCATASYVKFNNRWFFLTAPILVTESSISLINKWTTNERI